MSEEQDCKRSQLERDHNIKQQVCRMYHNCIMVKIVTFCYMCVVLTHFSNLDLHQTTNVIEIQAIYIHIELLILTYAELGKVRNVTTSFRKSLSSLDSLAGVFTSDFDNREDVAVG